MSRYFVSSTPVAVFEFDVTNVFSEQAPNIIWIKSKMDLQTQAAVQSELLKLGADNKSIEAHLGGNVMALLIHNIVRWEGPDFDGVPCTPATIRTLDPQLPILELVIEEITRRNARTPSPNPKSAGASTSASAGAVDLKAVANGVEVLAAR